MADPLDFDGLIPPKKTGAQKFGPMAILSALLPIAMAKGGREGVAWLMQGFQSAMQRQQQEQQQQQQFGLQQQRYQTEQDRYATEQDYRQRQEARQGRMDERQDRMDTATEEQRAFERRQAVMQQVLGALQSDELTDPASVQRLLELVEPQARAAGLPLSKIDAAVLEHATPSRLQVNAAKKALKDMKAQYGENAPQFAKMLPGEPNPVPYAELERRAGFVRDPNNVPATPEDDAPLDRRHLSASLADFRQRNGREPNPAEVKQLIEQTKKAVGQADDRPHPAATVLIQTIDPTTGQPVQRFVPKEAGAEFPVQPTATQQTSMAEQEAGLDAIANIEGRFRPEYVGPVQGRKIRAQMAVPGLRDVPQEIAEFYAGVDGLRNEVIRLMSGAAVSGSEEARMRAQLPDVLQKPSVFRARLAETKRNRETLLARQKARSGQPGAAQSGRPAVGLRVRNKQTGELAEVTGYTQEGKMLLKPVQGQ